MLNLCSFVEQNLICFVQRKTCVLAVTADPAASYMYMMHLVLKYQNANPC